MMHSANAWIMTSSCLQSFKVFPSGITTQLGMKLFIHINYKPLEYFQG